MTDSARDAVLAAEQAWLDAHLNLDVAALDALMHPDYTVIQPGGQIMNKAAALASYRSDARHWDHAAVSELQVRIYGEVAVVIGRWQARGVNAGQSFDYAARYTSIWVKHTGRWRIANDQSTEIR